MPSSRWRAAWYRGRWTRPSIANQAPSITYTQEQRGQRRQRYSESSERAERSEVAELSRRPSMVSLLSLPSLRSLLSLLLVGGELGSTMWVIGERGRR